MAKSLGSVDHSIQQQIQCQGYYPRFSRDTESRGGVCICVCVCVYNVYKKVRKSEEDRIFFFNFMELVNAIIVADKPTICRVGPGKR